MIQGGRLLEGASVWCVGRGGVSEGCRGRDPVLGRLRGPDGADSGSVVRLPFRVGVVPVRLPSMGQGFGHRGERKKIRKSKSKK